MEIKQLQNRAMEIREKYAEYERKCTKEWTNLNIMEGFVGDVGELMKIVMAKEGARKMEDVDARLAHELSDCLWSILVLARKYDIDLEKEFQATMDKLYKQLVKKLSILGN